jgi:hypothetical protein
MTLKPLSRRLHDGRLVTTTASFPPGCVHYTTSCGDGYSTRGDGEVFALSAAGSDPEDLPTHYGDFIDVVYLEGGILSWTGAVYGDYISMGIYIPPTQVSVASPGAGNCILAPSPYGGSLILPQDGGTHTVDLSSAYLVPATLDESIPPAGSWEWSEPQTGLGAITPGQVGAASYHLLTVAAPEVRFINRFRMIGAGVLDLRPSTPGRKLLPHWRFFTRLHSAGRQSGSLEVTWAIKIGRYRTS